MTKTQTAPTASALTLSSTWSEIRRSLFPAMRRPQPVGIVHNGSTRRVYECAFCGQTVSMSARWPMTVRVAEFINGHSSAEHRVEFLVSRAGRRGGSLAGVALAQMAVA